MSATGDEVVTLSQLKMLPIASSGKVPEAWWFGAVVVQQGSGTIYPVSSKGINITYSSSFFTMTFTKSGTYMITIDNIASDSSLNFPDVSLDIPASIITFPYSYITDKKSTRFTLSKYGPASISIIKLD